jgi:hypothetical protein
VRPDTGVLNKKEAKRMKTAQQVRADGRMVLARALCSWSGSDRQAIEIPNHQADPEQMLCRSRYVHKTQYKMRR